MLGGWANGDFDRGDTDFIGAAEEIPVDGNEEGGDTVFTGAAEEPAVDGNSDGGADVDSIGASDCHAEMGKVDTTGTEVAAAVIGESERDEGELEAVDGEAELRPKEGEVLGKAEEIAWIGGRQGEGGSRSNWAHGLDGSTVLSTSLRISSMSCFYG